MRRKLTCTWFRLQGGGALAEGGADGGVRSGQAGGADADLPAERTGDDGGPRGLAEEGGGPAGTGEAPTCPDAAYRFSLEARAPPHTVA